MSSESSVQGLVHALEQGALSGVLRRILLIVGVLAVATIYIIFKFRGLESGVGMDQAQIAREIARGHGFVTQTIRPLAVAQLEEHHKIVDGHHFPDTYHAPLNPFLEAPLMQYVKESWNPENQEIYFKGDRLIAIFAMVLFGIAVTINYFTAIRLFDQKLAVLGTGLTLVCDLFWKYTVSGLPQMLMLVLFSGIVHLLVRALIAQVEERSFGWTLGGVGVLFGLLLLAHGLTAWILVGALVFIAIAFKPRGISALIVLVVALAIYAPWLIRNEKVSGTPFGVALYSQLDGVIRSETGWMRQSDTSLGDLGAFWFRGKLSDNTIDQMGRLVTLLGAGIAPVFFLSLLHRFKRRETALLRWALLSMWSFSFLGMSFSGVGPDLITPNQLHLLFIPLMSFYGMALVMILWTRLDISFPYARGTFITGVFLLSGLPLIFALLPRSTAARFVWPPYAPPIIAVLNKWMAPDEVIVSDMPYAVAWYADRKSLWLPQDVEEFNQMADYNELKMPITGLYLTPVTSRLGLFPNIAAGEYKEWSGLILRNIASFGKFPLKAYVALPISSESIFYSDRVRWLTR